MKIFISWSGELSKKVAEHLSTWIQDTLQGTKTWISTEDIDKGTFWFSEIADTLAEAKYGILCLTPDNLSNPWILFEAGALSKGLSKNKVCPLLINLNPSQLVPPLSQLNATTPAKEDFFKLIKSINSELGDRRLTDERLEKTFGKWWDVFDTGLAKILTEIKPSMNIPQKTTTELLEEILESTRSVQRSIQGMSTSEDLVKTIQLILNDRVYNRPNSTSFGQNVESYMANQETRRKEAVLRAILDSGGGAIDSNINSAKALAEKKSQKY
jgi:hypothetical protein